MTNFSKVFTVLYVILKLSVMISPVYVPVAAERPAHLVFPFTLWLLCARVN